MFVAVLPLDNILKTESSGVMEVVLNEDAHEFSVELDYYNKNDECRSSV